jgi:hypothetical protein
VTWTGLAAAACFAGAAILLAVWWAMRRAYGQVTAGARLFTLEERTLLGEAYGANCIWRPCHWLPAAVALPTLIIGRDGPVFWVGIALTALTLPGLPMTRSVHRCAGTIQGGHQRAASRGGTTSLWNGEPSCGAHNRHQSATSSWAYAWEQGGPFTLVPYAVRLTLGSARLVRLSGRLRRS